MNFVSYRLPNGVIRNYSLESGLPLSFDYGRAGFVICGFDPAKPGYFYPIKDINESVPEDAGLIVKTRDFRECSKTEYENYVARIKDAINGNPGEKIVASRRKTYPLQITISELFKKLCQNYPDAYVFLLSTEEFGTWVGASPELLIEKEEETIRSMSLAGTRGRGIEREWDVKNIREQTIVTDFIMSVFKKFGLDAHAEGPLTKRAGNVEHLMSRITARAGNDVDIVSLLSELSPTPALSGFPKEKAISLITKAEGMRCLYGGYCGPVDEEGNFTLNVILRCGTVTDPERITLFAGGGVTCDSDPEGEWEETEKKLKTLSIFL